MLNIKFAFTSSVLFITKNLPDKPKMIAHGSSRALQLPPHLSKSTISG